MMFLYNLIVRLYHAWVSVASLFNHKAKLFTQGRKRIFPELKQRLSGPEGAGKIIWFHCASLGEFEQGRPVIEQLKKEFPAYKILLTFFSPSGYEVRKNYELADHVFYLPADTPSNAKKFIETVQPELAIFVKYEFWLNYLNELKKNNTPTLLVSGIFRPDQHFFKWYGSAFKRSLHNYAHLFLQNEESLKLLQENGIKNCSVAGDTRFDRVFDLAQAPKKFDAFAAFSEGCFTVVAGSTWPGDEELLIPGFHKLKKEHPALKLIIAPHAVDEKSILNLISVIENAGPGLKYNRYTKQPESFENNDIVIVDTIGMLSSLYQYGRLGYIGGGFGSGIHNILEAMAYGLPVVFGPNFQKFNEAKESIKLGAGFCIADERELRSVFMRFLADAAWLKNTSGKALGYVQNNAGSTKKIIVFTGGLLKK